MPTRHPRKLPLCHVEHLRCARATSLAAALLFFTLAGCGAPGEPVPPSPPIPVAVTDLTARQSGDGVELTFTLPTKTVAGDRLTSQPAIEILRGGAISNGTPDKNSFRVVYTVPGALVANYVFEGHVKFVDPVAPSETAAHPGGTLFYVVRTRAAKKRSSADSNIVPVKMFSVAEPIGQIQTRVTETSIELNWPAPTRTSGGQSLLQLSGYHVYRGELDPASAAAASTDLSKARWKTPLLLLASPTENSYNDVSFEFGKTYLYVVRSVVIADGNPLESSDSTPAIVTPRDTFPPAAPQNFVAAVVPGSAPGSAVVDLSWGINLETDLAGYRVYRSEQQGTRGELVTPQLLLAPAYRDTSVVPGHRYWYTVTALDRASNESASSTAVAVDVTVPSS